MSGDETKVLQWVPKTNQEVLGGMHPRKLQAGYTRPSHMDTIAKQAICVAERSTCLWYEVGALLFAAERHIVLSSGYNGAARGDVDPREAGCARVVDGALQRGKGLCRGSHAELNAINNLTTNTTHMDDLEMIVTLHPCYTCAKQIKNKGIRKVWFLWEYGREEFVTDYLEGGDFPVEVEQYHSDHLEEFVQRIGFHPISAKLAK